MPSIINLHHRLLLLLVGLVLHTQLVARSSTHPSDVVYTNRTHAAIPDAVTPCLLEEASALLRLKQSFISTGYSDAAFRSWRAGTDCCHWEGIDCLEGNGHVTSLDLGDCLLESGRLDPSVFELTSLRYLNLGGNYFNSSEIPSKGFEKLTELTDLNLSASNFGGQVPHSIGRLMNLVSLDLSSGFMIDEVPDIGYRVGIKPYYEVPWLLKVQNITTIVENLRNLRELHLGFVDLSQSSAEWCDALATHTPNLRVLNLPFCKLSTICGSLSALHSLSVIDLQFNGMTGPFPNFVANFSFLNVLQLSYNHLEGWVSPAIFEHKTLVTTDLHRNPEISGNLPNFSSNSNLQNLNVGSTNFSGAIPSSISNLKSLKKLGLGATGFSGNLPSSIGELRSLNVLSISGLDLAGPLPSWVTNLTSLEILLFSQCGLYGSLPSSIGHLAKLRTLAVVQCKASREIPPHISNVTQLQHIVLSSNNFTGIVELNSLWRLPNLEHLDLSNNKIPDNSSVVSFPNLTYLKLASCSITKFPSILRHINVIGGLDLSNNQIHGAIPQWAWEKWTNLRLFFLNFSHNMFTNVGYDTFLPFYVHELDLSSNMFEGPIPLPQHSGTMLDYSNNMFSSMPPNISTQLQRTSVFKASGNKLSGRIPASFCNNIMEFLDLSYNNLNGSIPSCLMEGFSPLTFLNLKENQLHGKIPQNISGNCELEVLDISNNSIKGQLPRSLAACKSLEVLDIGHNEISDSFPCWMSMLPKLQVLVINSNKFFGQVEPFSVDEKNNCKLLNLRILDLSSNNFLGTLTEGWFTKLKSMMVNVDNETQVMEYRFAEAGRSYQVSTALTYKGSDITMEKILRTLAFIDISNNAFQGSIPADVGELVLLNVLNMSYNGFTGPIPSRLGGMNQLESLDLSSNELSGEIPEELASLNFLATLNLSNNKLVGSIPETCHFMTFTNGSFLGNDGLCGPPLTKKCTDTPPPPHHSKKKHVDFVLFLFVGLGFGFGFAIAIVVAWAIPIRKRS